MAVDDGAVASQVELDSFKALLAAAGSQPLVHWDKLSGVPADLADGDDGITSLVAGAGFSIIGSGASRTIANTGDVDAGDDATRDMLPAVSTLTHSTGGNSLCANALLTGLENSPRQRLVMYTATAQNVAANTAPDVRIQAATPDCCGAHGPLTVRFVLLELS